MSNQEQSFPQSAQEANEEALQQNPSVSQEDLPALDEEQLEAVVGAGAISSKFAQCCGSLETRVLGGSSSAKQQQQAEYALIDQWHAEHNTPDKVANPSWNIGRSSSGRLVQRSPLYSY